MTDAQTLEEILGEVLKAHPAIFVVEAVHKDGHHEFILDGDQGIGIATIAEISRSLNHFAEERMPDNENYSIDVMSPGADSPIKQLRQYNKHIGRQFDVKCADGTAFKGYLRTVEGHILGFEIKPTGKVAKGAAAEQISIPFEQIKKATIILSFK